MSEENGSDVFVWCLLCHFNPSIGARDRYTKRGRKIERARDGERDGDGEREEGRASPSATFGNMLRVMFS